MTDVFLISGLPNAGPEMETPGAFLEAATKRADGHFIPDIGWVLETEDRRIRAVYTRGHSRPKLAQHELANRRHKRVEITRHPSGRWRVVRLRVCFHTRATPTLFRMRSPTTSISPEPAATSHAQDLPYAVPAIVISLYE